MSPAFPTLPHPRSLSEIRHLLDRMPEVDAQAAARVRTREMTLTKPAGALGRLEELTEWLAGWQGRTPPDANRFDACVFAGTHGVVAHGVSAYPTAVTAQMVSNFRAGGAAVNQLCKALGVNLRVVAFDLTRPAADITQAPSLSEPEFVEAFARGLTEAGGRPDLLCLGEMGIGNTTAAAAIACALFGGTVNGWIGPGTGVAGARLAAKTAAVEAAVCLHAPAATDPLDLLRRLGGYEGAAIAGAVVGARLLRVPVLLDGFVCTAAAAPLARVRQGALDHCRIAHVSAEPGHRLLADRLGQRPLLALDMRLGEASGAVLASALVRAAVACHVGMATFETAQVSGPDSG